MNDSPQVTAARIEVERARARLLGAASELQERLKPKTLAREAWEGAKTKGADLAEEAVDAVKARPFIATGIAAVVAMFLAREPLMDMANKVASGLGEKRTATKRRKSSTKPAPAKSTKMESVK